MDVTTRRTRLVNLIKKIYDERRAYGEHALYLSLLAFPLNNKSKEFTRNNAPAFSKYFDVIFNLYGISLEGDSFSETERENAESAALTILWQKFPSIFYKNKNWLSEEFNLIAGRTRYGVIYQRIKDCYKDRNTKPRNFVSYTDAQQFLGLDENEFNEVTKDFECVHYRRKNSDTTFFDACDIWRIKEILDDENNVDTSLTGDALIDENFVYVLRLFNIDFKE